MSSVNGLIVSFRHSDGYAMFYRKDSQGYTYNIDEAGRYTVQEGLQIQESTHGEDVWIPESEIYEKSFKVIETAKIKPLNEIEQFAAKLYDYLLKTELGEDGFNMGYSEDQQFYGYEIVDKPLGDKQNFDHEGVDEKENPIEIPEEFKYIDHEYCYQWRNGGYEGDSFAGELYIPLPNGQYLECHYEN